LIATSTIDSIMVICIVAPFAGGRLEGTSVGVVHDNTTGEAIVSASRKLYKKRAMHRRPWHGDTASPQIGAVDETAS